MSAYGQFSSPGANDWVERLRDAVCHEAPPIDEAVLDAAYDACEIDTPTMFAYFEGTLSEEERLEVEAEVAASPHALRKLARIGAIVGQNRTVAPSPITTTTHQAAGVSKPSLVCRVRLSQPRASIGSSLPRSEDCQRLSPDSPCEFFRSLEKNRDQLLVFHHAAPAGTLLGIRLLELNADRNRPCPSPPQFAVLRRGTESMTTTALTIPLSFKRGELYLEIKEVPLSELSAQDVSSLLNSYEKAAIEDPISVSPLHEPRSAWQLWADGVLKQSRNEVDPAVWEVAELIAAP
jgi:hypothetical protein